jgi:hypothetical protein
MSTLRLVPASGPPIDVQKDSSLVGREPTCDIVVADGSVSRKHARIERRGDIWYAVDQGSANGTFLDSVRVGESPLRPGQELRFGAVSYRVEIEGGAPDPAATMGPDEAGATVIQPALPPARPPSPPPPPAVTAEVRLPGRRASPPPPASVTPPGAAGAPPISVPPGPRQGRSPAFWILSGGCGCLLLLALLIVGLVVLPCGGAFTAMWKATEAPVAEIRAQLQEIKAGQLDAAYARFSESYRATVSRSDFEALIEAHPALKDNADSTFNQRNITTDTAVMSGSLKSSAGAVEAVSYQLVPEGGTWKIAALRFAGDASVPPLGSPETGRTPGMSP